MESARDAEVKGDYLTGKNEGGACSGAFEDGYDAISGLCTQSAKTGEWREEERARAVGCEGEWEGIYICAGAYPKLHT